MPFRRLTAILIAAVVATVSSQVVAEERVLTVAVASNFTVTAAELIEGFSRASGHRVRVSTASTGKLYAQIVNGAPFDVFLAADIERPRLLEASGLGVEGTRFAYAYGSLVLWSREPGKPNCRDRLDDMGLDDMGGDRLAIANPVTAPYGAAAREFLQRAGVWEAVSPRLVIGENISQTLQFAASGNAGMGLISASQLNNPALPPATCRWRVPESMHAPIEQQAILLRRAADEPPARAFLDYLRGPAGRDVLRRHGYALRD